MGPDGEALGFQKHKELDGNLQDNERAPDAPITFRMATEEELRTEESQSPNLGRDSQYGIQSISERSFANPKGPQVSAREDTDAVEAPHKLSMKPAPGLVPELPSCSDDGRGAVKAPESSPTRSVKGLQTPSLSHSRTSLSFDSQVPSSSLPSSPKSTSYRSLHPSDEDSLDESNQHAIVSSSEDDAPAPAPTHPTELPGPTPQLIMPSIQMPSRRPFTERGKELGKLKILLAGGSGVGKTSLIKSIIQTCDDIVHVDPTYHMFSPQRQPTSRRWSNRTLSSSHCPPTPSATEIYASTRPYPTWWSSLDNSKLLHTKQDSRGAVLERNLCFVDTIGYDHSISKTDAMDEVLHYVEGQFHKSFSLQHGETAVTNMMSGVGGCQVDLVFYLIQQAIKEEDLLFIERLSALSNVVVLISKSDLLSPEELEMIRRSCINHAPRLSMFKFLGTTAHQSPFKVCSTPSDDDENMDASLLMSSDYLQPLVPSDLATLIGQVLDRETAALLKRNAATRLVRAYRNLLPSHSMLTLTTSPQSQYGLGSSQDTIRAKESRKVSTYKQAKMLDHTQQEEKLAQIRLAKWAADLQRSLQNERDRYEALARGERVEWLRGRLSEASQDSKLIFNAERMERGIDSKGVGKTRVTYDYAFAAGNDPLGLLYWSDNVRERGWVALQVAGGFGILGAFALWAAKNWSFNGIGMNNWSWPWLKDT